MTQKPSGSELQPIKSPFRSRYLPESSAWLKGSFLINTLNRIANLTGQLGPLLKHFLLSWAPIRLSPAVLKLLLHSVLPTESEKSQRWRQRPRGSN